MGVSNKQKALTLEIKLHDFLFLKRHIEENTFDWRERFNPVYITQWAKAVEVPVDRVSKALQTTIEQKNAKESNQNGQRNK